MSQFTLKRPDSDMQKCIIRPDQSKYYAVHHIEQPVNQPPMTHDPQLTIQHYYGREGRHESVGGWKDVSDVLYGKYGADVAAKVAAAKERGVPSTCKLEEHYLSWKHCKQAGLAE